MSHETHRIIYYILLVSLPFTHLSFCLLSSPLSSSLILSPPLSTSFFSQLSSPSAVPPVILSHPLPYTNLMGTPTTFNLTVQFRSRFRENTTVTWQRNNSLLPDEQVQTNYTSENEGITVVNFPTVSRSDAGLYQVTIKNALEVIPTTSMTTAGVYQLHVIGESTLQNVSGVCCFHAMSYACIA